MRAKEFILEAGEYKKGYQFVDKLLSPEKWTQGSKFSKNYQAGQDKVGRLLDPTRWFEKKTASDSTPQEKPTNSTKIPSHVLKQTIQNLSAGRTMFRQDIMTLKTMLQQIKSGELSFKVDQRSLENILKSAINQQTISDEDKKILAQVAGQIN